MFCCQENNLLNVLIKVILPESIGAQENTELNTHYQDEELNKSWIINISESEENPWNHNKERNDVCLWSMRAEQSFR